MNYITTFLPEFKGLREFNKKGLRAIILELSLYLDYDNEESVEASRLLIKALIDQDTGYYSRRSVDEMIKTLRHRKPSNMTWRDFETYSRNNFDDFEALLITEL